jgi:hypothetical protein
MADQLAEFIHKKVHAEGAGIDWSAKKNAWIQSVEGLYKRVELMLKDPVDSGDVSVETKDMVLTEDFLGTYAIPMLELRVGNERVEFRPMGLAVFGSEGRVDIRGARDVITLVRDESGSRNEWTMVLQRVPDRKTAPLDAESLQYALERVMLPMT